MYDEKNENNFLKMLLISPSFIHDRFMSDIFRLYVSNKIKAQIMFHNPNTPIDEIKISYINDIDDEGRMKFNMRIAFIHKIMPYYIVLYKSQNPFNSFYIEFTI